jgi:multiple sugar transport system substrate-binding protein
LEAAGAPWERRLSRRRFLKLAGATAAGLSIAGCSRGSESIDSGSAAQPVQLVYQDWRTPWFPPMVREQLEAFHAAHPDISVFYSPDPENEVFQQEMLADFQAGTAADVFQGCCAHFPIWAQKGFALDLLPFIERDIEQATLDDWDIAQYRALSGSGIQFGVPKYHGALALYYNKDLFDRFGVGYPTETWDQDDYAEAMRRLTRDVDGDGVVDLRGSMLGIDWDRLQVHANAWGGHFVDPDDPTRCLMGEPEAIAAIEWLRALMWDEHVMATPLDVGDRSLAESFVGEKVAMIEDGSWALRDILEGAQFRVGVAPLPAGPAGRVTLATTDGFGIFSGTRYPEQAWEFVKFLISPAYGLAMAEANFLQPARLSLIDDWAAIVRNQYTGRASGLDLAVFAAGHKEGYSVTAEVFPVDMEEATRLASQAWEDILLLGNAPVGILREVATRIEETQRAS